MKISTKSAVVICECGKKHRLIGGIDKPLYWCAGELIELMVGDEIEYKEIENGKSKQNNSNRESGV